MRTQWGTELESIKVFWLRYLPSKTDFVVGFFFVFLALRVTLLTPGYIDYADIGWALDPHLIAQSTLAYVPSLFVRGSFVSLFSLTRDFISWPYLIFSNLTDNMQLVERMYMFYGLYLFIILCYVFAKFFLNQFMSLSKWTLTNSHFIILKHSLALFAFSNLLAINYVVDGGFFSVDLIMIFISIEVIAAISIRNNASYVALVGALLSLTVLIDPDYYIISLIAVLVILLVSFKRLRINNVLKRFFYPVAVSIPIIIFIQFTLTFAYAVPGNSVQQFYRGLSSVYFSPGNHVWWLSIVLLGYAWSIITYGPPSVMFLGNKISWTSSILGPTQILLPPGLLTVAWLVAIYSIPVVSFFSLAFNNTRKYVIPAVIVSGIGILLSIYGSFPFFYNFLVKLSGLPLLGQSISTTFSLPDHFLILVASSYLVLFPATLFNLLRKAEEMRKPFLSKFKSTVHFLNLKVEIRRMHKRTVKLSSQAGTRRGSMLTVLVIIIIFLMLLADWQAFDGSYYPARADNSLRYGNGVPNAGSFSPYNISNSYLEAYYYIVSQEGNFNVYWPIGLSDPPAREISLPGFPYLGEHNLTFAVAPYLEAHSVKYVAVYDLKNLTQPLFWPVSSIPGEFLLWFGIPTYNGTLRFLNESPGLTVVLHNKEIYLYQVNDVNGLYYNSTLLLSNTTSQAQPYLYAIFKSMGFNVSFTSAIDLGNTYGLNSTSNEIDILSPSFIAHYTGVQLTSSENNVSTLNEVDKTNFSKANNASKSDPVSASKLLEIDPFSGYLNLSSGKSIVLDLRSIVGTAYVEIKGIGSIDNSSVNTSGYYVPIAIKFDGEISFSGNISIAYVVLSINTSLLGKAGSYVVYNGGVIESLYLTTSKAIFYPSSTSDGSGLYINVTGSNFSVNSSVLIYVQFIYYLLLGYLVAVTIYLYQRGKNENP